MRGQIDVRETGAPLPETPSQAIARGNATRDALLGKIKSDVAQVRPTNAGPLHLLSAGAGNAFGASALRFLPGDVSVKRGDWMAWTSVDPFEIHTVTFVPQGQTPPDLIQPRPQPSGPPMLVSPANVVGPAGSGSFVGDAYTNSGFLFPGDSTAWLVDAPPGTYTYYCVIHGSPQGGMRGTITVTG
jgi:plastocyanin